jgi:ankyrin repeat protein
MTRILLEHLSTRQSIKGIFDGNNYLLNVCNLGCLNAFKQLIEDVSDINKKYDKIEIFMINFISTERHALISVPPPYKNISLLQMTIANLNHIDISFNKKHIVDNYNGYVEIAKLLIDRGANIEEFVPSYFNTFSKHTRDLIVKNSPTFLPNDVIKSYINEFKNKIVEQLLIFVPKVLAVMITDYT